MPTTDPAYDDLLDRVKATLAALPRPLLEDLRAHLDDLLPSDQEVARAVRPEAPPPRRVTRRKEWVRCGRAGCRCENRATRHGPYWYLYWRENGKVRKRYDGRAPP